MISAPPGLDGSSVRLRLLRLSERNAPPSPARRHRPGIAVFTSVAAIDANHTGAHVGEQRSAVRARDESSEIDHTDSRKRPGLGHV